MMAPKAKATRSRTPHSRTIESKQGIGDHFLGDQAAPMSTLLVGMAQLHEHSFNDLPLPRRPLFAHFAIVLRQSSLWIRVVPFSRRTPLSLR